MITETDPAERLAATIGARLKPFLDMRRQAAGNRLVAVGAWQRQAQAVALGARLLVKLAEPYWPHACIESALAAVLALHLYARILDDAVDEALPVHRHNLLAAQGLFWQAVSQLAQAFPQRMASARILIDTCTQAAAADMHDTRLEGWAAKNHHLLLAPLVLAPEPADFEAARAELSNVLFVLQAAEELNQSTVPDRRMIMGLVERLYDLSDAEWIVSLKRGGWHRLAQEMAPAIRRVLGKI